MLAISLLSGGSVLLIY